MSSVRVHAEPARKSPARFVGSLLKLLARERLTKREIQAELGLDQATVARWVECLYQDGLLNRRKREPVLTGNPADEFWLASMWRAE